MKLIKDSVYLYLQRTLVTWSLVFTTTLHYWHRFAQFLQHWKLKLKQLNDFAKVMYEVHVFFLYSPYSQHGMLAAKKQPLWLQWTNQHQERDIERLRALRANSFLCPSRLSVVSWYSFQPAFSHTTLRRPFRFSLVRLVSSHVLWPTCLLFLLSDFTHPPSTAWSALLSCYTQENPYISQGQAQVPSPLWTIPHSSILPVLTKHRVVCTLYFGLGYII